MRISESEYRALQGKEKKRTPYNVKYAKRADANQPDIVQTFRKLGFMVQVLHEVGGGVTDIAIGKHGLTIWVEIKDGLKVPSAREYTTPQRRWHFAWAPAVMRAVATCKADCLSINSQVNAIVALIKLHNIDLTVTGSREKMYEPSLH